MISTMRRGVFSMDFLRIFAAAAVEVDGINLQGWIGYFAGFAYHGALATWQANAIWVSFVAGQETTIIEDGLLPTAKLERSAISRFGNSRNVKSEDSHG